MRIGRFELYEFNPNGFDIDINLRPEFGKQENAPRYRSFRWFGWRLVIWRKYTIWGDHPFKNQNIRYYRELNA
jgi:hypothetical protein